MTFVPVELSLCLCLLAVTVLAQDPKAPGPSMHTVFTTECTPYFNWQTLGLLYSHHKSGQPGPVTRLMSCTDQDITTFRDLEGVQTHIAPSWTHHPLTGDIYRSGAMSESAPTEEC